MMTIIIHFHQSNYRDFKAYYEEHVMIHLRAEFPKLVSKTVVANAFKVRQIAEARVKTDKEDVRRLITLLIADSGPEVWVPPMHVRELRSLISFRWRLGKQITTLAP